MLTLRKYYQLHIKHYIDAWHLRPIVAFIRKILIPILYIRNAHHRRSQKQYVQSRIRALQSNLDHRKKTIIITTPWLIIGGVERVLLNIAKDINRGKFNVVIVTTGFNDHPWHDMFSKYADGIIHLGKIYGHEIPSGRISAYICHIIESLQPDILLTSNSIQTYKAIPKIKQACPEIKIVDILHSFGTKGENDAFLRRSYPYDKLIDRRIMISEFLKDYYLSNYDVDKEHIQVIYNSIDTGQTIPRSLPNNFSKVAAKHDNIITYVGRLDFDKSPERLVEIARQIQPQDNCALVLVGDGTKSSQLKAVAKRGGVLDKTIYFLGSVNNPLGIMKQSKFTILVSDMEGMPMTMLESMSVGTPCIAPQVGGIPEIITNDKVGYLVDMKGADDKIKVDRFYHAIKTVIKLSPKEYALMSKNAKKQIDTRFRSMTQQYNELFDELTGEGATNRRG